MIHLKGHKVSREKKVIEATDAYFADFDSLVNKGDKAKLQHRC